MGQALINRDDIRLLRAPWEDFVPKKEPVYEDVHGLMGEIEAEVWGTPLMFEGPPATGKSTAIQYFAYKKQIPIVSFDCSEDTRAHHMRGNYLISAKGMDFVLGFASAAIDIANETKGCILLLEEVNSLTPQIQKALNPILDWRRELNVPEAGRIFRVNTDALFWVVLTMNNAEHGGTYELNHDFMSRVTPLPVEYYTEEQELIVVKKNLPMLKIDKPNKIGSTDISPLDKKIKLVTRLARESRQGKTDYSLTTRCIIQFLTKWEKRGLESACKMISGKFARGSERDWAKGRITSIFGIIL